MTAPGAGPHGDRTPRADPSLRESGGQGRTGDVQLGKISVGIEAAHVKWFSHGGPDVVANGLSLCSLHHKAFDLRAIAISTVRRCSCPATSGAAGNGRPASFGSAVRPLWGRKRACHRSARSLRRGTARRCFAGRIVCSGEEWGR
jgi:HNH endonuclease